MYVVCIRYVDVLGEEPIVSTLDGDVTYLERSCFLIEKPLKQTDPGHKHSLLHLLKIQVYNALTKGLLLSFECFNTCKTFQFNVFLVLKKYISFRKWVLICCYLLAVLMLQSLLVDPVFSLFRFSPRFIS